MTELSSSVHGQTGSADWVRGADIFIPISLGNHFYSSEVLRKVLAQFVSKSRASIIFLCNRLRFLSYRIRGETDIDKINATIGLQLEQITRALNNVGLGSYSNATVGDWSFLQGDPRYLGLVSSLEDFARNDSTVNQTLGQHATQLLSRFSDKSTSDELISLQIQYILEETSLSLYMTEVRGFNVEVYRRGMGFVDYLYNHRPDDVQRLTGAARLSRRFVAIEDWLSPKKRQSASGDRHVF